MAIPANFTGLRDASGLSSTGITLLVVYANTARAGRGENRMSGEILTYNALCGSCRDLVAFAAEVKSERDFLAAKLNDDQELVQEIERLEASNRSLSSALAEMRGALEVFAKVKMEIHWLDSQEVLDGLPVGAFHRASEVLARTPTQAEQKFRAMERVVEAAQCWQRSGGGEYPDESEANGEEMLCDALDALATASKAQGDKGCDVCRGWGEIDPENQVPCPKCSEQKQRRAAK